MLRNNPHVIRFYQAFTVTLCVAAIIDAEFAKTIISLQGYLVIKLFAVFNILLWIDKITYLPQLIFKRKEKKQSYNVDAVTVEGIPLIELVSFCFSVGGFPVHEALSEFGINKKQFKAIGDKLESLGILIRGERNARVVNDALSEEEIIERVVNVIESGDVDEVFTKGENSSFENLHYSLRKLSQNT